MSNDRKRTIERVKALLAKTTGAGCTEAEAMAALAKAREMMDAHDIGEADVTFGGEGVEQARYAHGPRNMIVKGVALALAKFCGCKVWNARSGTATHDCVFLGLESDVAMATWMMATIEGYVSRATADFMRGREFRSPRDRNMNRNGFILGCVNRIAGRLNALAAESAASSPVVGGKSLVVVKGALVDAALAKLGLNLKTARAGRRTCDGDAVAAGRAAGDGASFHRPVTGSSVAMIGRVA